MIHYLTSGRVAQLVRAHHQQPGPRLPGEKKAIEAVRDGLKPGEAFYYADEVNARYNRCPEQV